MSYQIHSRSTVSHIILGCLSPMLGTLFLINNNNTVDLCGQQRRWTWPSSKVNLVATVFVLLFNNPVMDTQHDLLVKYLLSYVEGPDMPLMQRRVLTMWQTHRGETMHDKQNC